MLPSRVQRDGLLYLYIGAVLVCVCCFAACRQTPPAGPGERATANPDVASGLPPHEVSENLVRRHLDAGNYHEALRALPRAMAEWAAAEETAGHSFEGAAGFVYGLVMSKLAFRGDAHWGTILSDPEIPYAYKTALMSQILEERLGKGAVYWGDRDHLVVQVNGRVDLDRSMLRLVENDTAK